MRITSRCTRYKAALGGHLKTGHGHRRARLDPPAPFTGATRVDIRGLAGGPGARGGPGFARWTLQYGAGSLPSSWTTIAASRTAIPVEGLLASWNIQGVPDGTYTLRLSVRKRSGEVYEDRRVVTIDQVAITYPEPTPYASLTEVVRGGEAVAVMGTAAPADFVRYTITIRHSDGQVFANPALIVSRSGTRRVRNSLLALWDTTGAPPDHYFVELAVTLASGPVVVEQTHIIVDPTLHPGWPQSVGPEVLVDLGPLCFLFHPSGWCPVPFQEHLIAADIDHNGAADLLLGYGDSVRILDHTGAELPGWPETVDPEAQGAFVQSAPLVGDLTGDGAPEIVAVNNLGQAFVWAADGTPLPDWPRVVGSPKRAAAVPYWFASIADIDGDGRNEIVMNVLGFFAFLEFFMGGR